MTLITLIPEVPAGTKKITVFDTNAYRVLTRDVTLEEARARAIRLRELGRAAGETALASPLVVWELLTHLADQSDHAYENCLSALVALGEHTREPQTGGITMALDSEWAICHHLFGKAPAGAEANVTNLARIACYIRDHAPSITDPVVVSNIGIFSREMERRESSWIGEVQTLLDQVDLIGAQPLGQVKDTGSAHLRKLIARPEFEEQWSILGVSHYAQLAGVALSADELKARAEFFQKEFAVPFRLITGLLSNMLSSKKAKLTNPKRNRGNFMWDAGICYMIPGTSSPSVTTPMRIITGDKAIVQAAALAQCADKVVSFPAYLKDVGAPEDWAEA